MAYVYFDVPGSAVHAFEVTDEGRSRVPVCGRAFACLPYQPEQVDESELDCWECESLIG